jgi:hypothetical protein
MSTPLVFSLPSLFHEAVKYELIRSLNNWPSYEHTSKHKRARADTQFTEFKLKYFGEMSLGTKGNIY